MSISSYELNAAEILGFVGGVVLAVALLPQVMHTLQTRSTKDISYTWQLIYIFGLILNYVYFVMLKATAGTCDTMKKTRKNCPILSTQTHSLFFFILHSLGDIDCRTPFRRVVVGTQDEIRWIRRLP